MLEALLAALTDASITCDLRLLQVTAVRLGGVGTAWPRRPRVAVCAAMCGLFAPSPCRRR